MRFPKTLGGEAVGLWLSRKHPARNPSSEGQTIKVRDLRRGPVAAGR